MTREQAKELLPFIKAFSEGKIIQYLNLEKEWVDREYPSFDDEPSHYRIKPESKYRPFKSVEECWNEMQKHQPFGWLKTKNKNEFTSLSNVRLYTDFKLEFNIYTFADGSPFGIKE